MTLLEFVTTLNHFIKENPETLEMQVITSKDPEGNGYSPVYYAPSKGIYDGIDFILFEEYKELKRKKSETNAVCLN